MIANESSDSDIGVQAIYYSYNNLSHKSTANTLRLSGF